MKRKIVITIIMTTMLSLVACGKQTTVPEEAVKPAEAEEIIQDEPEAKPEIEEEVIDLDKEIVFTDEYLAKEAKEKASSLTVGGLQEITDLSLNYDKITVPEELAYFTNLQSIEMDATNKGDISWLSYFPNLKYLDLDYNHIDNIDELGKCTTLVSLEIESYNITDISFLNNLKLLEELFIKTDSLQDFSPIGNLTNLSALCLGIRGTAESLNIDFSMLTNLKLVSMWGSIADYTSLNSLNVYDEPVYIDVTGYWDENYSKYNTLAYPSTTSYRDDYSLDKRPEKEYFRSVYIQAGVTDDTIRTAAQINYKYLQSL